MVYRVKCSFVFSFESWKAYYTARDWTMTSQSFHASHILWKNPLTLLTSDIKEFHYLTNLHEFLFKGNGKVVCYLEDVHTNIVPVSISCHSGQPCSLHGWELGKSDDIYPLIVCTTHSKTIPWDEIARSLTGWFFHRLWIK